MFRTYIIKNKEFIKEKKEKFRQKKQRKIYGTSLEKNDKKAN